MATLDLDLVLHDDGLPALVAIRQRGTSDVLGAAGLANVRRAFSVVSHHPGERCVMRVQRGPSEYYVKAYAEPIDDLVALHATCERHGLVAGRGPAVPRIIGVDRDLRFLVLEALDGIEGDDLLVLGLGARVGQLAATWLRAAAAIEPDVGRHYCAAEMLDDARRWVRGVTGVDRSIDTVCQQVIVGLEATTPELRHQQLVNGSFYPRHLIDLVRQPGVVDWDAFRRGSVALDAAQFCARLRRIGLSRPRLAIATADAELALRKAAADLLVPAEFEWYLAASLLKTATHALRRGTRATRAVAPTLFEFAAQALPM